jgi:mono/diheme cytochrome c family protein
MAQELKFAAVVALALIGGLAGPSFAQPSTRGSATGGSVGRQLVPASDKQPMTGDQPGGGGTHVPKAVTGAQIYRQVCQACHMADAKGASGAGMIPALAGNPRLNVAAYPITVVVRGKGAMPSMAPLLDQKQVAEVVGYVRTNFGNAYPKPVTEADVKKLWVAPPETDH